MGSLVFPALCGLALWLFLFGYDDEPGTVSFYRHPSGYEVAETVRFSGLIEQDANYQVLVRANARSEWKALWKEFHRNSNPRFYWSKQDSLLFINECVPISEQHSCGANFLSTAYDFQNGKTRVVTDAPNRQTDSVIRSLVANRAALFEAQPIAERDLANWFWQDRQFKWVFNED